MSKIVHFCIKIVEQLFVFGKIKNPESVDFSGFFCV